MKMEYGKMMEQVSLSEPARADILEQLEQKSPAKRRIRPLRVALIAACVCLALVGGAFAAHLSGVWLGEQIVGEDSSSFRVEANLVQWEMNDLGEQLQSDLEQGTLRRSFQTRGELEEYLGIELIGHSILETAPIVDTLKVDFQYNWNLRPELKIDPDARYVLSGMTTDNVEMGKDPQVVKVTTHRVVDNFEVYTDARLITEYAGVEEIERGILGEFFDDEPMIDTFLSFDENGEPVWEAVNYRSAEKIFTSEQYVTANGLEATVVTVETVDRWVERQKESGLPFEGHGARDYVGFFVYNGVLYTVRPWAIYDNTVPMNCDDTYALKVLKSVLDGFEF